MDYLTDPWTWSACLLAVALIGMSKGGFAGLGSLATPIVALVLPPVIATGILLPVLISQDMISVWSFRREWDRWIVAWMLPGAIIGVALGWYFTKIVDAKTLSALIGLISAGFAVQRLWLERGSQHIAASNSPGWVGMIFGAMSGFTSQIAHAGPPPFQMWVTPRQLPHTIYVGTSAVMFAAINLFKVPAYFALGALTPPVLRSAAILIPFALLSTYFSLNLVRRIHSQRFYRVVYWLMFTLGIYLIIEAF